MSRHRYVFNGVRALALVAVLWVYDRQPLAADGCPEYACTWNTSQGQYCEQMGTCFDPGNGVYLACFCFYDGSCAWHPIDWWYCS